MLTTYLVHVFLSSSPLLLFSILYYCVVLSGRYEYSQSFRDSQSSDSSVQVPSDFGTNMVYYYDDGNKVQMYTVDEKLLKEYIKRQMWVFDVVVVF